MRWGDALPQLEKAAARGVDVPALRAIPVIADHLRPVMQLWTFLHGRRQVGFAANPITLADMMSGLDFYEIVGVVKREDWLELLVAMDQKFLAEERKKTPRKGKRPGKKSL